MCLSAMLPREFHKRDKFVAGRAGIDDLRRSRNPFGKSLRLSRQRERRRGIG